MIHTKLLIRRLAYVPWLLAFGLVLGWAGEAQAQVLITLSVDKMKVREDGGATEIEVTAKRATKDPDNPTYVGLTLGNAALGALNSRFYMDLPTIIIPKDTAEAKLTITLTPIQNMDDDGDLVITIESTLPTGDDGYTITNTDAMITLVDDDGVSEGIELTYGGAMINQDGDRTAVTVTATLDGATLKENLRFALLFDPANPADRAVRDRDWKGDGVPIVIRKGDPSGTAKIEITPLNKEPGGIELTTTDMDAAATGVQVHGIVAYVITAADGTPNGEDPTILDALNETVAVQLGGLVDYNRDGFYLDTAVNGVKIGATRNRRIALTVTSGDPIVIDATKKAAPDGVKPSLPSVREDAGEVVIDLVVTLKNELSESAQVSFTIEDPMEDEAAKRDVDYRAGFSALTIPAGSKEGTATLTLTVLDNDGPNVNKSFVVVATVTGAPSTKGTITISDNETPTDMIMLEVDTDEVTAGTSEEIMVTGTINGKRFEEDVTVVLVLAAKTTVFDATAANVAGTANAQRDIDFDAVLRSLTISAGEISGSTSISITALKGGDAKLFVTQLASPTKNEDGVAVNAKAVAITLKDAPAGTEPADPGALAFEDSDVDLGATVWTYVAGKAIDPLELPAAMGGTDDDKSYSVSALPAGLLFDAATQTISGTPTAVTEVTTITYTVLDTDGAAVALPIKIEVDAAPAPTTMVASVSATQTSIRENGETTVISITATLAEAAPVAGTISFTIGNATDGAMPAVRDVDYTASLLGNIPIEAGATQASSTLTLTPINNDETDGNRSFGVHAAGSGGSASTNTTIADDETASTSISLSVSPHTVAEGDAATELTITATLDGKVLDDDATVTVTVDPASEAMRDSDYRMLFHPTLTIVAGAISGSINGLISPLADDADENSESITLNGVIEGLENGTGTLIITDIAAMDDDMMMDHLAFAEGMMIDDVGVTQDSPMSAVVLPVAAGGEGDIAYTVSELPAGLLFDAEARTLSGSTDVEGAAEVTYTATAGDESVSLTFTITVNPPLTFGDFLGLFTSGAGKANPAQENVDGVLQIVVGQPYSLTLPAVEGGTPPYSYSLTGLPAGLSFDPDTRTVSGSPTTLSETVAVTYTVTDGSGASRSLPILVAVVEPPLDAPDALVALDYKGADGAGDQGGFVLLTWDLSEHHDGIDGYRIFRELPVLGNEMVPWAMVDAVPGVQIGRAVVATLDNVATNWGIAAELGGQTTHSAAKAVFVNAENPYELMAETMTASRDAAQAGDAPVFASLLPEAFAYAQGVAPKLNLVAGVLSSAITLTEEPVRATDDIAPLAVPSLSVLDAPNDAGSRILLTWALSPSDQLLQGVIAEAFGPTALEQVVGVHGYGIYRRAAGEDEFVLVAQVDAGITSFVDETALNGVRYTYQVRSYDLDNETGSDLEQTAMAVRNSVLDSEGRALFGLFGVDNRIGFDDFFIFADSFGLTAEDAGFDPAFDLAPNATIDFDDFFVFADNFGRSTAAAGKRVPMLAGLNADARMYLDARTVMPIVGEDFVLDVRVADFAAIKGYGLQVQYETDKLEFVEVLTDQPLSGSELATPQVLADQAGVLTVAAYGDVVSVGEVPLSLVFRAITEIENTVVEITDNQTYDSEFGFNRLALPAPVQLQTRPEAFALANNYPNPFNPATTIKYALPQAADVQLTVYNVVGQPVRMLVADHQSAGRYVVEWDATNNNGHSLASGMYFYRLQAGEEFLEIKKMLLLK